MFRPFDALAMPNAIEDCLTNAKAGLESHPINNGNRGEMVAVPPPAMKNRGEVVAYCPVRLWTCAHVLTLLPCQRMASSPIDGMAVESFVELPSSTSHQIITRFDDLTSCVSSAMSHPKSRQGVPCGTLHPCD
jgi:hypothetical protein